MRGLAVGNSVWRLLQADDLTVGKFATVVDERHGANGPAYVSRTTRRFVDLAAVDLGLDSVVACETAEEGDFHVRNDWCCTDDQAFNAHQLVSVCMENCQQPLQEVHIDLTYQLGSGP